MATQGTATNDFGSTPVDTGSFNIVDASLSGLTYAEAWVMQGSTATNNATHHQMANSLMSLTCAISGTTLNIIADSIDGLVTGQFSIRYVAN